MNFIHIDHTGSDSVDQVMAPLYGVADMYVRKATRWGKTGVSNEIEPGVETGTGGGGEAADGLSRATCITETTTGYSPLIIIGCKFEQVEMDASECSLEKSITE